MSEQRYLVTARKYRPALFHEVVAQEHVTDTLKNAIRLDRLAHAYLFSGPRGVGKTTAARILAKAINCTTPLAERTDQAEPCRQCNSCRAFEEGRSLSIFEIDAASNNKVEDIRDLRETVRVPPQGSRKKVYIIDEVHMLSTAAFNALLKTLEEPPPYVLFIFATTEPHKVLPTILSRCQRFDFRRIPVPNIVSHLHEICSTESITADEESLLLIARKGDGALRDALSAFDQAVSLCGTNLQYAELSQALRVVDVDLFFEVTRHVQDRSSAGMLRLVDHIVTSGYDLQEFLVGLADHLRNILVALTMSDTALIEAAEATRQRYTETSHHFTESTLLRLLMIVDEAEESIKSSSHPRMKLEMALLKMASLAHAVDLREALQKLDQLETLARKGKLPAHMAPMPTEQPVAPMLTEQPVTPPPPVVHEPVVPLSSTQPRHEEPAPPPAPAPPEAHQPEHGDDTGTSSLEETQTPPVDVTLAPPQEPEEQATTPEPEPIPSSEERPGPAPVQRPAATSPSSPASAPSHPPSYPSLFGTPALKKKAPRNTTSDEGGEPQALFAGSTALKTVVPVATAPKPALTSIATAWSRYVRTVKTERIHVGALLQHTSPVDIKADAVLVGVPDEFHRRLLSNQHDFLLKHFKPLAPQDITNLVFTIQEDLHPQEDAAAASEVDPHEYMQRKREENPVIQAIFDQFGGELVW